MTDRRTQADDSSRESSRSDPEWADVIRSELGAEERTPAERAAFRMRLDERVENRGMASWRPMAVTACVAVAAAFLWFAMPRSEGDDTKLPDESLVAIAEPAEPGLLSYAYYETDYLAGDESGTGLLSDEYQAIANAFEVP